MDISLIVSELLSLLSVNLVGALLIMSLAMLGFLLLWLAKDLLKQNDQSSRDSAKVLLDGSRIIFTTNVIVMLFIAIYNLVKLVINII